jgi:hypothetical protein
MPRYSLSDDVIVIKKGLKCLDLAVAVVVGGMVTVVIVIDVQIGEEGRAAVVGRH